jgi:hypothetical protein
VIIIIVIIKLPDQAIASTPSVIIMMRRTTASAKVSLPARQVACTTNPTKTMQHTTNQVLPADLELPIL